MTTWRSAIDEMPECDPDHPYYPVGMTSGSRR